MVERAAVPGRSATTAITGIKPSAAARALRAPRSGSITPSTSAVDPLADQLREDAILAIGIASRQHLDRGAEPGRSRGDAVRKTRQKVEPL